MSAASACLRASASRAASIEAMPWAVRATSNANRASSSRCVASVSDRPPPGVILTVVIAFGPPTASSDAAVIVTGVPAPSPSPASVTGPVAAITSTFVAMACSVASAAS